MLITHCSARSYNSILSTREENRPQAQSGEIEVKNAMHNQLICRGMSAAGSRMFEEDKVWSRYSHDKVDIGEELAKIIRTLNKTLPLSRPYRALSIGSSDEPQFRLLETAFRGALYLIDIEKSALGIVKERLLRQKTAHVFTIQGDYNDIFLDGAATSVFLKRRLAAKRLELITLHHSLYYSQAADWPKLFYNLYGKILAPRGAIHAVLMASKSVDPSTTTWLYNHFAGKFFGCRNDQDLGELKKELSRSSLFRYSQILLRTHRVRFYVDDFVKFMAVVWMILLYPNVHKYSARQRREITEFIYKKFWAKKRPLIQEQHHLVIYKGIPFKGLV